MQIPKIPFDEIERLAALRDTRLLDTAPEEAFDRLTRLAAQLLDVPIVLISLVDHDRLWFKSRYGLTLSETARDISFCGHALHSDGPFIVNDALQDPRFSDNPLVIGAANVRSYAGIPLHSTDNHTLGTLCVIDHVPRKFSDREQQILVDLASIVEELIHQREAVIASENLIASLRESDERHRRLIEQSPDGYLLQSNGIVTFVNAAALLLLGGTTQADVVGQPIARFIPTQGQPAPLQPAARTAEEAIEMHPVEQTWLRLDGTAIQVEVLALPFAIAGGHAMQVIVRDISARKRYQQELEHLANHDLLTHLPNRALLMERMRDKIGRWQRAAQGATVAFVNIDHFTYLNDTFGHKVGDQALRTVANALTDGLDPDDLAARIGGDEFVVVFEDRTGDQSPQDRVEKLLNDVSRNIRVATHELAISCSIGVSRYPEHGTDPDALINAANAAMSRAKQLGRANSQMYSADLRIQASERLTLESQLRTALKNNELELHYQPKVCLHSGTIVGLEALVRWQHPQLGMIAPGRFIPIAEESGLIVPIGEWILRTACDQIKSWRGQQLPDITVAVNLSSLQFLQRDLVATVRDALDAAGVAPACLELELTESMSMENPEKSIAILRALKDLGVALSIDDFGTGYSSLGYLKRFPLDKLKIDRSFIADIQQSSESVAIIQAIIAMAHRLGLQVIAEGVETERQLVFLMQNQCDEMQGYYFSKPLPVDACTAFLQSGTILTVDGMVSRQSAVRASLQPVQITAR